MGCGKLLLEVFRHTHAAQAADESVPVTISTAYVHLQINELRCVFPSLSPSRLPPQTQVFKREEGGCSMTGCSASPSLQLPPPLSSPLHHNYTPSPHLSAVHKQLFLKPSAYFLLDPRTISRPGRIQTVSRAPDRAHGWPAITLAPPRNTDGERKAALTTAPRRLCEHSSSSQQDTSHHSGMRIFVLNK